ncbi:acyl-CoA thioester hydrolase YbgC [bacterium BMS3Abin14]|nr:acyl-CoA thioester hydrolase YbgC [bacterium BMS3Abin14]
MSEPGRDQVSNIEYRVCYEDTDSGGVVYYGNYLRYFERGRTECLRARGCTVKQLDDQGFLFPVIHAEINYRSPGFYDDLIRIETGVVRMGRTSVTFEHRIFRSADDTLMVEGRTTVVCVGRNLRPKRIPKEIRDLAGGPVPV